MHDGSWTIDPCAYSEVSALATALEISETTASILVRRGYADTEIARSFLEGERPPHDPLLLGDMAEAVTRIRAAIAAGKKICVHGDYDVDGICATALAVLTLRELGAEVEWHLPSRFEEGYGVSGDTISRLADEGCGLLLTVDCGITAVAEVAAAKARGLEVIVTDHHRPRVVDGVVTLPDCPIVATRPSDYPFPELCGTGVVHKLAQALLGVDHEAVKRHADLVALATIADVVPLLDENRSLAIAGLRALARTQKPGLRALMRSAHVDPAAVDSSAVGFRLAPRINAAGRLGRPDAALDLLLATDEGEATRLAGELETLNRDRQGVEDRILRAAVAEVESWPEPKRRRRGYVLWGEDWHEGVIGIVASRLVEKFNRPIVMIAGTSDGDWKGSGRSVSAFDLHGALAACSEHLGRFGGHRAAAGLSIAPENLEAFAAAFAAYTEATLSDSELLPVTKVDAIVPGAALTLGLAQELDRLAPFGLGNPDITLLVPSCEAVSAGLVGEGKHLRFRVRHHGRDAGSAIAFGLGEQLDRLARPVRYDLVCRLKENRWNGTVAPQLLIRKLFDAPDGYEDLRDHLAGLWKGDRGDWTSDARAVFTDLELEAGARRQLYESESFRALLVGAAIELPRAA
ncbi:MAG TPA: single-stranded-DNA-specific exonuclease RecJ [Gaiellaceae bacterium]|nr:single-stranded-DNA-specific exonuclease RecJ [Gaiellaceae bacterium]